MLPTREVDFGTCSCETCRELIPAGGIPVEGKPGWYLVEVTFPVSPSPAEHAGESAPAYPTADETAGPVSREGSAPAKPIQEPSVPAREMTYAERFAWNAAIDRIAQAQQITQGR